MFASFSNTLTKMTNHYIDWSRVGNLVRSGTHRYSTQELVTRGSILAATAVSAFLGAYYNDEETTNRSDGMAALAAGLAGFVLSHTLVIASLIKKRCDASAECNKQIREINVILERINTPNVSAAVKAVIDHIQTMSLSNNNHSNASATWGRRLALLTRVKELLLSPEGSKEEYWNGGLMTIMNKITEYTPTHRLNLTK